MSVTVATRLSVAVDTLVAALGTLSRTVERRNTIVVLGNVLIEVVDGGARLTATDLDIWVTTTLCLADTLALPDARAAVTVPALLLQDIARKLPKGAEAAISWDETEATLVCGKARYRLNALPATDYPALETPNWTARFTLPAATLKRLMEKTAFAICNDEIRYYLNGIFLHVNAVTNLLTAVATDGHRLSRITAPAPDGARDMPGAIIPKKAVGEISRLLDGHTGDVEVSVCASKLMVEIDGTRLVTKLIDGTFPDYERVIPAAGKRRALIDAAALAAAADRVSIVSGERGKAVKLTFDGPTLKLEVRNPDAGDASEELADELEGDPLEIGFNARYLAEALRAVDADTISLQLGDAGSPAVMTSVASTEHLVVIMPMRV